MKPSTAQLRLASPSGLNEVLPLFRAFQAHYSALTTASEEQTRAFLEWFLAQPDQGFMVVAEVAGRIVGFATAYFTLTGVMAERLVHLGDLYVVPEYRSQGVGRSLIDAVTTQARERDIRWVRWLSLATNTELNRWYESLGATSGDFRLFLRLTAPAVKSG